MVHWWVTLHPLCPDGFAAGSPSARDAKVCVTLPPLLPSGFAARLASALGHRRQGSGVVQDRNMRVAATKKRLCFAWGKFRSSCCLASCVPTSQQEAARHTARQRCLANVTMRRAAPPPFSCHCKITFPRSPPILTSSWGPTVHHAAWQLDELSFLPLPQLLVSLVQRCWRMYKSGGAKHTCESP